MSDRRKSGADGHGFAGHGFAVRGNVVLDRLAMMETPCGHLIERDPPECQLCRRVPHDCRYCEYYSPGITEQEKKRATLWAEIRRLILGATLLVSLIAEAQVPAFDGCAFAGDYDDPRQIITGFPVYIDGLESAIAAPDARSVACLDLGLIPGPHRVEVSARSGTLESGRAALDVIYLPRPGGIRIQLEIVP